jgi:hypothetical protein
MKKTADSAVLLLFLPSLVLLAFAPVANWPSFRGPQASGVADGRISLSSEDGDIFVAKSGVLFELASTNPMGERLMATPALSEGTIYMRSERCLFAFSRAK